MAKRGRNVDLPASLGVTLALTVTLVLYLCSQLLLAVFD